MPDVTLGLSPLERFTSPDVLIQSESVECKHGKHYHVVIVTRACGHRRIAHATSNYREHWKAMYAASEALIVARHSGGNGTVR